MDAPRVPEAVSTRRFGRLKYREIRGRRMAYVDEGEGEAIVFQHGQPTSSYVWRNVMPHLQGLGRLVACDLIGMGESDKLTPSGPDRYGYSEHRDHLFELWDALELGDRVVLVLDDWGATLGFDWANGHRDRVQGIVHMEPITVPMQWADYPEQARPVFEALRSPAGERMVLEENFFIEKILPMAILRSFEKEELEIYRGPYLNSGEDRRPTLSWPRTLPIEGAPATTVEVMNEYLPWISGGAVPKLFITGDPGQVVRGRIRDLIRTWKNQVEVTVKGRKLLQEDSPDEIGAAIADFVRRARNSDMTKRKVAQ